ncbi:DNA-directed RNA polymerase subunit omega [Wolbachia endosymbiont of Folsomia candida]|uniref:DNA-directed RNA polymerase subunit omega n=1 Tax=Wolbachia endosymbiont of Folsomia candida TaxID=169402 RepID=UPI000B2870DF|nr:DNA-directed RNA polymerase subunit omega [Wolbachia endosymbiont of Folsomia candida]APR98473.1 DNA-directed RNA polymerase subunit omega [Wolbachia endosymbiont of Folsomia candida]
MAESIVEKCIEQVSNRFKLSLLASQRTHDLNTGASNPTQVTRFKGHKNTIISLYEIAEKQVDVEELFGLLVGRCKEYMKGNTSNVYSSDASKLEKLLNFSNDQFNVEPDQETIDTEDEEMDDEIDSEIDDQDGDEE